MKIENFNIRIVKNGDKYGLNFCLTNNGETMVEFYDSRFKHTEYGQFVSRYYVKTLIDHKGGLALYGSIPEWSITAEGMKQVTNYISEETK